MRARDAIFFTDIGEKFVVQNTLKISLEKKSARNQKQQKDKKNLNICERFAKLFLKDNFFPEEAKDKLSNRKIIPLNKYEPLIKLINNDPVGKDNFFSSRKI